MTLKFYSSKAYKFVRETFALGLPHPSTIRTWYGAINADPGFTQASFSALSAKFSSFVTLENYDEILTASLV